MFRKSFIILELILLIGPAAIFLVAATFFGAYQFFTYYDTKQLILFIPLIPGFFGLITSVYLFKNCIGSKHKNINKSLLYLGIISGCSACFYVIWLNWLTSLRILYFFIFLLPIVFIFHSLYICRMKKELQTFGLLFVITGTVLLFIAIWEIHSCQNVATWPKTSGRITRIENRNWGRSKYGKIRYSYKYTVDGENYTGHDINLGFPIMQHGWDSYIDKLFLKYDQGRMIFVYYDPLNPNRAVLQPGISYSTFFILTCTFFSLVFGFVIVGLSFRLAYSDSFMINEYNFKHDNNLQTISIPVRILYSFLVTLGIIQVCIIGVFNPSPIPAPSGFPQISNDRPKDADGYLQRAIDGYFDGDLNSAIADLTSALRLDSKNADIYYWRGIVWTKKGESQNAIEDWKTAIQIRWKMALNIYYCQRLLVSIDPELTSIIKETALNHLTDLEEISGYAVGYSASPGSFYTALLILSNHLTIKDFLKMTQDENPVTRAMGMIYLARQNLKMHRKTIESFFQDNTEVKYVPVGCVVTSISLSELAKNIIEDPNILNYWSAEKTNRYWREDQSE